MFLILKDLTWDGSPPLTGIEVSVLFVPSFARTLIPYAICAIRSSSVDILDHYIIAKQLFILADFMQFIFQFIEENLFALLVSLCLIKKPNK